jgi:hypothetical protein
MNNHQYMSDTSNFELESNVLLHMCFFVCVYDFCVLPFRPDLTSVANVKPDVGWLCVGHMNNLKKLFF